MKQVLQNLSNGEITLAEVPSPSSIKGHVIISTNCSLISSGTERMLLDFGKAGYLEKALQQPEKVKEVLEKVKTDGIISAYEAVQSKLSQPLPLGYSNAGVVLESSAQGFNVGDRVVSNGCHAEVVRVPANLCCKIPDSVSDQTACFTVLSSIALQGIRLVKPTMGEAIVVYGLGLVGLLTVQLLKANGCKVLGIDNDSERCSIAKSFGIDVVDTSKKHDVISANKHFTRGRGADAVIIAASTKDSDLISQATAICRKRARIVLVGVIGLNLNREEFYEKEITFRVSTSYGPGRYDSNYEEKGQDYPISYVRWTEQRNFEAVLELMATNKIDVKPLISANFQIEKVNEAYQSLSDSKILGIILDYPNKETNLKESSTVVLDTGINNEALENDVKPVIGFIGAGNYGSRILLPLFRKSKVILDTLLSSEGLTSYYHGKKTYFRQASTDISSIWNEKKINTVVIASPHNKHAEQVLGSLQSSKHIYVEKPLALNLEDLESIKKEYSKKTTPQIMMVGFNRRFAPLIKEMKSQIANKKGSKVIVITVNVESLPPEHWAVDEEKGGGRIIGEACHFIDLMRFLIDSPIADYQAMAMKDNKVSNNYDIVTMSLSFEEGSMGTIHYLSNGGKSFPKERVEVFCESSVLQLDNYRMLEGFNWPGFTKKSSLRQDKGHKACIQSFLESVNNNIPSPIPFEELMEVSRVSIEIANSLKK